jgi:hypothetical protein
MAEMDKILKYSVEDTKSAGDRTKYAAVIRAILGFTPKYLKGFITCALRYTLTLRDGFVIGCSPNLSHTQETEGYHDDDYTPTAGFPRLGNTGIMGTPDQKQAFETLIEPWFEYVVLGLERSETGFAELRKSGHKEFGVVGTGNDPRKREPLGMIHDVLSVLVPNNLLRAQTELSMKVDVYTDRTVYGWHKDWNDGHALVVGLLNVSQNALSSAELVFVQGDTGEDDLIRDSRIRHSSTTRTAMRRLVPTPAKTFYEKEDQPSGEIRWFNDVVWVHRTPPMGNFGHRDAHSVTFSIANDKVLLPLFVADPTNAGNAALYADADQGRRMLLRVTIRDMYEPCTEAWYDRAVDKTNRKMWFRVEDKPRRWRYKSGLDALPYEIVMEVFTSKRDPRTNKLWCLQSCNANGLFHRFDPNYWTTNPPSSTSVPYEFEYRDDDDTWKRVPSVHVPKLDILDI